MQLPLGYQGATNMKLGLAVASLYASPPKGGKTGKGEGGPGRGFSVDDQGTKCLPSA